MRQLERDMPDDRLDARTVARFQVGILQFMEFALGPNSMPPRPFPKLPFSWIDDVRPGGALHDIILKCYQLKESKGMKTLDWRHPQQRMQLVEILENVRSSMAKNQYQVTPTVYFDESVPQDEIEKLKAMVLSLKGKIASERNAVGLTHIVYPFGPGGDPDDGEVLHASTCSPYSSCREQRLPHHLMNVTQSFIVLPASVLVRPTSLAGIQAADCAVQEYMRTQRKRNTKSLVHRWYRPDSHNEWIDQSVAPEVVENDAEHLLGGPAKVFVRWVRV